MGYYIDLEKISIDKYCSKLKTAYLPPSRVMLRDKTEERFGYFKSIGIKNVKELIQLLKKKDQFAALQKVEYLPGDYLTILLRELNSILPKPNKISEFKGISKELVRKLEDMGIKNTVKLYERVLTAPKRSELAMLLDAEETEILMLSKLTDLSRIKWVGTTFARILFDLGFDTVEKVSKAESTDLHRKVNLLSKEQDIYKGHIGLNDIKILIDAAKEVPLEIKY